MPEKPEGRVANELSIGVNEIQPEVQHTLHIRVLIRPRSLTEVNTNYREEIRRNGNIRNKDKDKDIKIQKYKEREKERKKINRLNK
jgi:ribosomal protein L21